MSLGKKVKPHFDPNIIIHVWLWREAIRYKVSESTFLTPKRKLKYTQKKDTASYKCVNLLQQKKYLEVFKDA